MRSRTLPRVLAGALLLAGCSSTSVRPPVPIPSVTAPAPGPEPSSTRPAVPTTSSPDPDAPPARLPGAATTEVNVTRTGLGHLDAVRLGRQAGYDRLVLEFTDQIPGYRVGYRPLPVRSDGSGQEIPMPGATTSVVVTLHPGSAHQQDTGAPTYAGHRMMSSDTVQVTQAAAAGDFEAVLTWVVGLRTRVPFRVSVLSAPPRLVVDFQHRP